MNKNINKLILSLILGVSVLSGCSNSNANVTVSVTAVKGKAQYTISDTTYDGAIEAYKTMEIIPNISGKVSEVKAELGQMVEKGDILFQLDNEDSLLQLKQAKANYEASKANYEKTVGGVVEQTVITLRQTLDKAENELNDAQTSYDTLKEAFNNKIDITPLQILYDTAKNEYERIKTLFDAGVETQVNLDNQKSKQDSAKSQLDSKKNTLQTDLDNALMRLNNAKTSVSAAKENLDITILKINPENANNAKAQMDSSLVAMEIAEKKMADTIIRAPISGMITVKNIQAGDMVLTQSSAMRISDTSFVEIPIQVTESTIANISLGQKAEAMIQATNQIENFAVSEISPVSDATSGMFTVKLKASNPENLLKEGMTVSCRFVNENNVNMLLVPEQSVIKEANQNFIYLAINGKAVKKEVNIGENKLGYIEILDGLDAQDVVIVEGVENVEDQSNIFLVEGF